MQQLEISEEKLINSVRRDRHESGILFCGRTTDTLFQTTFAIRRPYMVWGDRNQSVADESLNEHRLAEIHVKLRIKKLPYVEPLCKL